MLSLQLQEPVIKYPSGAVRSQVNILTQYLGGPERAAQRMTAPFKELAYADTNLSADNLESAIGDMWEVVLSIAAQIPYDHPWQYRLVALVEKIRALPLPSPSGDPPRYIPEPELHDDGWNSIFHHQMIQDKSFEMGRIWSCSAINSKPFSVSEWTNFCAFNVHLTARGVVNNLEDAEELFHYVLNQERPPEFLNNNISAAAVWIIFGGGYIYYRCLHRIVPFNMDKWSGWKRAFQVLKDDQSLHCKSRDWADGAWE